MAIARRRQLPVEFIDFEVSRGGFRDGGNRVSRTSGLTLIIFPRAQAGSALEPLQHPLQLCVLKLKLARQLRPQHPDFFIKAYRVVKNGGNVRRALRNDVKHVNLLATSATTWLYIMTKRRGFT